jgi:multiple sugar transport system permease protein
MSVEGSMLASPARNRRGWSLQRREALAGILFALPALVGFFAWSFGPIVASAVLSLTDYGLITSPHWVGLHNYIGTPDAQYQVNGIVNDSFFWTSLEVTVKYTAISVPLVLVFSFAVALLLAQPLKLVGIFRAFFYIPALLPAVATAIAWLWLYNPSFGLLNTLLDKFNLPTSQWIDDENTALASLIVIAVWSSGAVMIVFLAAIKSVPLDLYDAAAMDGAGVISRLWHVTIPAVSPVILFNLITSIIAAIGGGSFTQAVIMTNGGPNNSTLFFSYYLYRVGFQDYHLGYACALGWVIFLIILVVTGVVLSLARSRVYYEESGA